MKIEEDDAIHRALAVGDVSSPWLGLASVVVRCC